MALFKKFFKPKSQHENPEVRRKALDTLQSAEQLITFIRKEPEASVRDAALARIQSEDDLESLLRDSNNDLREATRQHWLNRLLNNGGLPSNADSKVYVRIAALTDNQELRVEAIGRISDEQQRLQLASEHSVARVRMAAAEGIHNPKLLQALLDVAQGKDKAVYRLCKERLAAVKEQQEREAAEREKLAHLTSQAEQLVRLGYGPDFFGRLQVLHQRLNELRAKGEEASLVSFAKALEQADEILRAHEAEEQRRAEQAENARQAEADRAGIIARMTSQLEVAAEQLSGTWNAACQGELQAWEHSEKQSPANAEQRKAYQALAQQSAAVADCLNFYSEQQDAITAWFAKATSKELSETLEAARIGKQWLQRCQWPSNLVAPEWLTQLQAQCAQLGDKKDDLLDQQKQVADQVRKQMDQLEAVLDEGQANDAGRLMKSIQKSLNALDHKQQQPHQNRLRLLTARLNELRDWQGFAINPKKEQLCASMESIADGDMEPQARADAIQLLQQEWKSLGNSGNDRELWARFQAAADRAFEPCKAYFSELAEQRGRNVAARNDLTQQLLAYEQAMNWETADWKAVQQTLNAARDAFRQYSPVDRASHKDTQTAFQSACDAIYAHIKEEYGRNLALKEAIVSKAESMVSHEDLDEAIEQVKQMQQDWKAIGMTPKGADQKLWQQLRQHADAVFARLNEQRDARKAALNTVVSEAEAMVAEAQAIVADESIEAQSLANSLRDINARFRSLELPRSAHQRLSKALDEMQSAVQSRQQQASNEQILAAWNGVIQRLEALQAEQDWDASLPLANGFDEANFRAAQARTEFTEDAGALCVAMEILANIDSPEQDRSLRMNMQVQRLAEGLGKGLSAEQERAQLIERWLNSKATAEQLNRFITALNKAATL
ncbi:DUF349 domain-containing protein [Thalassolituus oleivorans]|uniref:DUF349 domain-containing protein n=1 Tax=Thalassolituus oleivorans TaxID=187493 RepID=UPI00042DC529|nr:DUF349 domain-containing protein [Thalassolituus oleivorans]AHK17667.1 hypothetical protein R615_11245 [Thalassolituus oleivorans R6-15]